MIDIIVTLLTATCAGDQQTGWANELAVVTALAKGRTNKSLILPIRRDWYRLDGLRRTQVGGLGKSGGEYRVSGTTPPIEKG